MSFCPGDRTGVWFEGTAHLAEALEFRGSPGDGKRAAQYLLPGAPYALHNDPAPPTGCTNPGLV